MQRAAALCLDLAAEGLDGSENSGRERCSRPVGAPLARRCDPCTPAPGEAIRPHAEDVNEKQAHHDLEDASLANWIPRKALHHFAVPGQVNLSQFSAVQGDLFALDDQQQHLLRVR